VSGLLRAWPYLQAAANRAGIASPDALSEFCAINFLPLDPEPTATQLADVAEELARRSPTPATMTTNTPAPVTAPARFSLASITKAPAIKPPKICLYGVPGIGKTSFAAAAPKPIFLLAEDGLGMQQAAHFPLLKSYQDCLDAIGALYLEQHDYETVVLDTADALEPMLWAHICNQAGKARVEDFGYGKGYDIAAAEWRNMLTGLSALRDEKGMAVILLAHSSVTRFEAPDSDGYDRYAMRLHKKANALLNDWSDCVLFANYRTHLVSAGKDGERKRAVGTGQRILHTTERPAWAAKNRYRLPDEIDLSWDAFTTAMNASLTA
jgi:hypothetical protein